MILIGQFDSPFVRRVGIALTLYGFDFEHRPWSVFGDVEKIAAYNPLRRVPTLVLDDGDVLLESGTILDHLDEVVGPDRALIPRSGTERRQQMRICALATGLGEKAVSILYERALHELQSERWLDRCRTQISDVLDLLETERKTLGTPFWGGSNIGHADIAVAVVLRFLRDAHGPLFDASRWPALAAHSGTCEAMPPFPAISQPFSAPA